MRARKWDRKSVERVAAKYTDVADFRINQSGAYSWCARNKLIPEITKNMRRSRRPNGYWTKDKCAEVAKKFNHRKDFEIAHPSAYVAARRNNWLNEICSHMVPKSSRLTRCVYEIVDHSARKAYIGITYSIPKRMSQHRASEKMKEHFPNGIELRPLVENVSETTAQKLEHVHIERYKYLNYDVVNIRPAGGLGGAKRKYTYEVCMSEAKKYDTLKDFRENAKYCYVSASRAGWLSGITSHMKTVRRCNGYWSKEKVMEEMRKCKNYSEFVNSSSLYQAAIKQDLVSTAQELLPNTRKHRGYWTKEKVLALVNKYPSMSEFRKCESSAYATALKKKWLT